MLRLHRAAAYSVSIAYVAWQKHAPHATDLQ